MDTLLSIPQLQVGCEPLRCNAAAIMQRAGEHNHHQSTRFLCSARWATMANLWLKARGGRVAQAEEVAQCAARCGKQRPAGNFATAPGWTTRQHLSRIAWTPKSECRHAKSTSELAIWLLSVLNINCKCLPAEVTGCRIPCVEATQVPASTIKAAAFPRRILLLEEAAIQ